LHSLAGLMLVRRGGFRLFEGAMTAMIALMFVAVMLTAVVVSSRSGLVWPAPSLPGDSGPWVLGVLGGVGGTVTLLAYGYWIAEHDRKGVTGLLTCRLDLTLCYALTGLFGAAMIVIASQTTLTGSGSRVAVELAEQLGATFGPGGRLVFLVGFWGAVFTSLLGVWQGVPYLFADFAGASREGKPLTTTSSYRHFQLGLATVPIVIVFFGTVRTVQLAYTVTGALFMPLLAVTLLILNNRSGLVGRFRNGWLVNLALIATLVLFVVIGADTLAGVVASATG
jgi:Mn2+/Fe2+ NRAMP family transporter